MGDFIKLKISEVKLETSEAITLVFDNYLQYDSGQFLTLVLNINGQEVRRSYSFSSSPFTDIKAAITIKKIEGGLVSTYLYNNAYVGLELTAMTASGNFLINAGSNQKRNIVLIAAGSGITPLFSMAKSILSQEIESRVSLLFSNKNEASIIFKSEIDNMIAKFPNRFECVHILSKANTNWTGNSGRIHSSNLNGLLAQFSNNNLLENEYYMCGPEQMMIEITDSLSSLGVVSTKIKKEKFSSTFTNQDFSTQKFSGNSKVTINIKNENLTFDVAPQQTILEAAKKANIRIPYSCESGVCTACMITCTQGKVDMKNNDTLSDNEMAKGYVLTCCGYAASAEISLKVD